MLVYCRILSTNKWTFNIFFAFYSFTTLIKTLCHKNISKILLKKNIIIVEKGTGSTQVNTIHFLKRAHIIAKHVTQPCTVPQVNLTHTADGRHSMTQLNMRFTLRKTTVSLWKELKFFARTAVGILDMFSMGKDLRIRTQDIVSIRSVSYLSHSLRHRQNEKATSSSKKMCCLSPSLHMAKKMGKRLGIC